MNAPINQHIAPTEPEEAGKTGEAGVLQVTNTDFMVAIFKPLPTAAAVAVCTKTGDPSSGGWVALNAEHAVTTLPVTNNNYFGCSSFHPTQDGSIKAQKKQFAACHVLMLDDLGTKVNPERLNGFELSWLIETSPGNYQGGIILAEPITDGALAEQLLETLIAAGLCDKGASGPLTRWARLPVAINGKPKYHQANGEPFQCRLVVWRPELRYTIDEIVNRLGLTLGKPSKARKANKTPPSNPGGSVAVGPDLSGVLIPKAAENPVITALKDKGLYKKPLSDGKHDVTCPWVSEHTDAVDHGSAYLEPDEQYPHGGFSCLHSHRGEYHNKELLDYVGVSAHAAINKPTILVSSGKLCLIVDAAEKVLAETGQHYQSGGLIVTVDIDPISGDPSIVPTNTATLTRDLARAAIWQKVNTDEEKCVPCDPPARHVSILDASSQFKYLPVMAGVVRQPYFREADGVLVKEPGYDRVSQRYGVFDPSQFPIPAPTPENARMSLALLVDLIAEFHFVSLNDKAAALSAIFTGVVRSSLAYAPAFHIKAPVFGSGKTYLCELIGAFAGPGRNAKVSYPSTSDEATKVILSLLLTSPAVIEFDDMDTDWVPHGVIKRMLTAEHITDRVLGVSKTATVSTRTLFLGSGNNVGPVRDLLRRVVTINVDPRCATPATLSYQKSPVDLVRKNRGKYVGAVLNIIQAWIEAGMPKAELKNIVTYGGAWTNCCRHPLVWLGHPDPASSMFEQLSHDPEADALGVLFEEWYGLFGNTPMTVRKLLDTTPSGSALMDALQEFGLEDRGKINRAKLGWLLKRSTNRIVDGFELQQTKANGRPAWRVIPPKAPALPPLPPSVH
jgi:hypothetical protein